MHVILDTNILVDNYRLDAPKFQALDIYLKKTKSKLLIPELVRKELFKKYRQNLVEYSDLISKNERILFSQAKSLEVETLMNGYSADFLRMIAKNKFSILKSRGHSSKKMFDRALDAVAPFDSSGRGLRDTLIWFDILEAVKESSDTFCFITANSKDFGKIELHKNLIDDLGKNKNRLLYSNSLESFLSYYGEQIAFIDKGFFEKFFADKSSEVISVVDKNHINKSSIQEVGSEYDIWDIQDVAINNLEIYDFYIYYSNEEIYKVNVEVAVTLELDLSVFDYQSEEVFGYTPNIKGYSTCWIEYSLIVNKKTREVLFEPGNAPQVGYAL